VQVSPAGEILQLLMDPSGEWVGTASAAVESDGRLFLGNLFAGEYISYVDLAEMQRHIESEGAQEAGEAIEIGGRSISAEDL
jgi:hypothetical protein